MPLQKFHIHGLSVQSLLIAFFLFDFLCFPLSASASTRICFRRPTNMQNAEMSAMCNKTSLKYGLFSIAIRAHLYSLATCSPKYALPLPTPPPLDQCCRWVLTICWKIPVGVTALHNGKRFSENADQLVEMALAI